MKNNMKRHAVSLVTASAGTGKTYDLTSRIEAEIRSGCSPEKILATTFTVKAAEELRERSRQRLIQNGYVKEAIELLGARISTINGVCGGLVKEFSFGLGLSPIVDIIDEKSATKIFNQSADVAIGKYARILSGLADCFGYNEAYPKKKDWREDVIKIIELARSNDINQEAFVDFSKRSIAGFEQLLDHPLAGETENSLDQRLEMAIGALLAHYPTTDGLSVGTTKALEEVRIIASQGAVKDLSWQVWAKLSKINGTQADDPNFEPLREAAAVFARHPRLRRQAIEFITNSFNCAAEAMKSYEDYKRAWGLVDFVDQDRLTLELFKTEELRVQLAERIETVFIDEFQDTSPLQLANFIALSQLVKSSIWVGDPKQAIYGFRGTDPDLITYVAPKIREATGGEAYTLEKSYRSRPSLVEFFNDAFGVTFRKMGMSESATRITDVERQELRNHSEALRVWNCQKDYYDCVAAGIRETLNDAAGLIIQKDGTERTLRPNDIAVLCRTNSNSLKMAAALSSNGLKVAIERDGLFGTLEARLVLAALNWAADNRNTVALAEMAHMLHDSDEQPEWFEASLSENRGEAIAALVPFIKDLSAISAVSINKSPIEFFDYVTTVTGLVESIQKWGDPDDRRLSIEAMRGLVSTYEEERRRMRAPTTPSDLCVWLNEQQDQQPPSRSENAVSVLTYHAAKGLEWPFVVLTELEAKPKARAFGIHLESDINGDDINWTNPLDGRWIRFWPWPFGAQKKDINFDVTAASTPEGKRATLSERHERARLLYVGATRARDYLVLALPKTKSGYAWLDELVSESGAPVITVPTSGGGQIIVNGRSHPAAFKSPMPVDDNGKSTRETTFTYTSLKAEEYPPISIRPSDQGVDDNTEIIAEIEIGERLPFSGAHDMKDVGDAIHRYLAADNSDLSHEDRLRIASRLLKAWNVSALDPRDVILMGDRFHKFIQDQWPEASIHKEAPISWRRNDQTMSGRIDVFVETRDEIIIIDHKSFPGARNDWLNQAKKYGGQLHLYAEALAAAKGIKKPIRLALHLPIAGQVLFLS